MIARETPFDSEALGRPVKLLVLSDLHLEHGETNVCPDHDGVDVVVLAGDIHVGVQGIAWARKAFPNTQIVYVAGNHEFHGHRWDKLNEQLRVEGRKHHVHFLENREVTLFGLQFLGATLWTDFRLFGEERKALAMNVVHRTLYDYRAIARDANGRAIVPTDTLDRHRASYQWLKDRLSRAIPAKTVVVTHHYPFSHSSTGRCASAIAMAGSGSDLDELAGKSTLWIHAHPHNGIDHVFKGTRVVCNPRTSGPEDQRVHNPAFNPRLILEIIP